MSGANSPKILNFWNKKNTESLVRNMNGGGLTNVCQGGETLGLLAKGIRKTLRIMAGLYLLVNLCVATIPRCDTILSVLQHSLKKELSETPSCHSPKTEHTTSIQNPLLCECTLVKFVFVNLPAFDPQKFIGFRVQTSTLIQFDYIFSLPSNLQGPEPPYPRWNLV
jgi:hypothetical protein